jgi:hypothetical protein
MDQFSFILELIRDVTLLFLFLGSLFITATLVKFPYFQLNDENNKIKVFSIGLCFLILGSIGVFFPKTVTIHGEVNFDSNEVKAMPGVFVEAEGANRTIFTVTDERGEYTLHNVPKTINALLFSFPRYKIRKDLEIPWWSIGTIEKDENVSEIDVTIEGTILDSSGMPVSANLGDISKYTTHTDNAGEYRITVPVGPNYPTKIAIKTLENGMPNIRKYIIDFSEEEIERQYKRYNITIPQFETVNVEGCLKEYCGNNDTVPEPIIGAIVEIDGRLDVTDENGNYSIANVPVKSAEYNITLISGERRVEKIIPPLVESTNQRIKKPLLVCFGFHNKTEKEKRTSNGT